MAKDVGSRATSTRQSRPKGLQSVGNFTIRALPRLREDVTRAAQASGRSISEEIGYRLTSTFDNEFQWNMIKGRSATYDMLRHMAIAVSKVQDGADSLGYTEAQTREAIRGAVQAVSEAFCWTPGTELRDPTSHGIRRADLPPAEYGRASAVNSMIFDSATSDADRSPLDDVEATPLRRVWSRGPAEQGPGHSVGLDADTGGEQGKVPLKDIMGR